MAYVEYLVQLLKEQLHIAGGLNKLDYDHEQHKLDNDDEQQLAVREYLQIDDHKLVEEYFSEPYLRVAVKDGYLERALYCSDPLQLLCRLFENSINFLWFVAYLAAENGRTHLLLQLLHAFTSLVSRGKSDLRKQTGPNSSMHIIYRCLLDNRIDAKICDISEETIWVRVDEEITSLGINPLHDGIKFAIDNETSAGIGHHWRLVHYAAARGDIECMKALIQYDQAHAVRILGIEDNEGCNAVHLAAYHGQSRLLEFMVDQMENLQALGCLATSVQMFSAKDKRGRAPLHYASEQGYLDAVQVLLRYTRPSVTGADVDRYGLTPLHLAACRGKTGVVEVLLKRGDACPYFKSTRDLTPRKFATTALILNDIQDKFSYDQHGAIDLEAYVSCGDDTIGLKPNLLQTEVWSPKGFTALHFAVVYGNNPDTIRKVLEHMEDSVLLTQDSIGLTPADWAASVHFKEAQDIINAATLTRQAMVSSRASGSDSFCSLKEARIQGYYQRMKEAEWERRRLQWTVDMGNALLYKHWNEAQNLTRKGINDLKIKINKAIWKHLEWAFDYTLRRSPNDIRQHRRRLIEKLVVALVKASAFSDHDSSSTLQTCLMWAIKEKVMVDLVEAIVKLAGEHKCDLLSIARGCEHKESPLEAATNMGQEGMDMVAVMEGQEEVRRRLYEDRQVYVDYANTILVAAVLIAALAFQAWVQAPQGYKAITLNELGLGMRVFDWCNSWGFFFSMGAVMAAAAGAMPMRSGHIIKFLVKSKQTATVASILMAASVACQVVGFASALMSLQAHHSHAAAAGMVICSTVGIILVFVLLVLFLVRVHQLQPLRCSPKEMKSWIFRMCREIYEMCRGIYNGFGDYIFIRKLALLCANLRAICVGLLSIELRPFDYAYRTVISINGCNICVRLPLIEDVDPSRASIIGRLGFALIYAPFKRLVFNPVYVYVLQPVIRSQYWCCSAAPAASSCRQLAAAVYKGVCRSFQITVVTPLVLAVYLLLWLFIHVCLVLLPILIFNLYYSPKIVAVLLRKLYEGCLFFGAWLWKFVVDGLRKLYKPCRLFGAWLDRLDQRANEPNQIKI